MGSDTLLDARRVSHLGQTAGIVALVTALVTGPITVLRLVWPDGSWDLLTVIAATVALEALLTTRWLRAGRQAKGPFSYRLAELTVIMIGLRLITWLAWRDFPDIGSWRELIINPTTILDMPFFVFALVALLAWDRSVHFSTIFIALDLSPAEEALIRNRTPGARHEASILLTRDRPAALQSFQRSWIAWGAILAFFTALTTLDLSASQPGEGGSFDLRNIGRLGLQPQMLLALLIYFVGGLWLASQGRMAVMRARWLIEGVEVEPHLGRRWRRHSLLLLLIFAGAAAFLPIGSTAAIGVIVELAINLIFFIAWLIPGLIFFILSLILPETAEEFSDSEATPFAPLDFSSLDSSSVPPNETAQIILGSIFWLISAAIAIAAILFFLRGRGLNFSWLPGVWAGLRGWLNRLLQGIEDNASALGNALRDRFPLASRGIGAVRRPWHYIRFNALAPRDQIRFLYLAAVRRAGEGGVSRDDNATPSEYLDDLKSAWPDAEEDLDALTDAFLVARYSQSEVHQDDVNPIKRAWQRLRRALRTRRSR